MPSGTRSEFMRPGTGAGSTDHCNTSLNSRCLIRLEVGDDEAVPGGREGRDSRCEATAITLGGKRGRVPLVLHDGAAPRRRKQRTSRVNPPGSVELRPVTRAEKLAVEANAPDFLVRPGSIIVTSEVARSLARFSRAELDLLTEGRDDRGALRRQSADGEDPRCGRQRKTWCHHLRRGRRHAQAPEYLDRRRH